MVLPVPPSLNRMYRTFRSRVYLSAEAKKYKKSVFSIVKAVVNGVSTGPIGLEFAVFRPAKRGDLDNYMKALLDSLTGAAYKDDKQVVSIVALRDDDKKNPRVELKIYEYKEVTR